MELQQLNWLQNIFPAILESIGITLNIDDRIGCTFSFRRTTLSKVGVKSSMALLQELTTMNYQQSILYFFSFKNITT